MSRKDLQGVNVKTVGSILITATLLTLAACAKSDGAGANLAIENSAARASIGNSGTFASDNVILPRERATEAGTTDFDATNLTDDSLTP